MTSAAQRDDEASGRATARLVLAGCGAVAFLDGFDTQAVGPAMPAIAAQLRLAPDAMGSVLGASQVGFLVGAIVFGALGDRFGRKRLLVLTTALFALGTLATALSGSLGALAGARVLAGLGLGGASPNFVSLAGEFAKPERRARAVTMLWAAVPLGGMVGAYATGRLLPLYGWQAAFLIGAMSPIPVIVTIAALFPESREVAANRAAPVATLFRADVRAATPLLWLTSFMTWSAIVVTALWMPALLQREGWSATAAASMLALSNAGGIAGTLAVGALVSERHVNWALIACLVAAGCLVAAMGATASSHAAFALVALAAGCATSAAGGTLLAVSAGTYQPAARSTGVGWALGVGRIGTVAGPVAVGLLLRTGASPPTAFAAIAAAALLGAGAAAALAFFRPNTDLHGE